MKIERTNSGYIDRVQPVKRKPTIQPLSKDNQNKGYSGGEQKKKRDAEFKEILKSKYNFEI